jgi:hypothetical protein
VRDLQQSLDVDVTVHFALSPGARHSASIENNRLIAVFSKPWAKIFAARPTFTTGRETSRRQGREDKARRLAPDRAWPGGSSLGAQANRPNETRRATTVNPQPTSGA